ncbi:hypothetical protein [Actinoplanes auranticolor]|uniref:Uncharacterized protein n=1 Tax=Actinoplanes auranticolor TaxID=47988 RepID=A0A919STH4_9ACTN|nr:hypothetical protein [Actinoplanes auranticolor]GIM78241.1 hypothetical protein Aau02nite_79910 [Actinoplanes auranticolor]
MAAYPFRMLRPGLRPGRFAGAALVLLLLAAGVLFSAGSGHHRHGHDADAGHRVTAADLACLPHAHTGETSPHGHEHGAERAPNLSPRARPAGHTTFTATVTGHAGALCPGVRATPADVAPRDGSLSLLGVLRV